MLPAVPKGSDSFLEAAVPLTFPHAAGHMEPALAVRGAWAGLFHGDKGRQSPFIHSCTHSFIHLVIMYWYPRCAGRCPNGIQPKRPITLVSLWSEASAWPLLSSAILLQALERLPPLPLHPTPAQANVQ